MDRQQFDQMARLIGRSVSRREAVAAVLGAALLGAPAAEAAKRGKGGRSRRGKGRVRAEAVSLRCLLRVPCAITGPGRRCCNGRCCAPGEVCDQRARPDVCCAPDPDVCVGRCGRVTDNCGKRRNCGPCPICLAIGDACAGGGIPCCGVSEGTVACRGTIKTECPGGNLCCGLTGNGCGDNCDCCDDLVCTGGSCQSSEGGEP
jgi:hypothetical protein